MPYFSYSQISEIILDPEYKFEPDPEGGRRDILLYPPRSREPARLRLPVSFPEYVPDITPEEYRLMIGEGPPAQIVILIRAGHAALGYYEGDKNLTKRFTRYMVRRGQGKSQLTYEKTRGKSRLGSRIRLQQGLLFFRDIRRQLRDWLTDGDYIGQIFISCPIRLRNELFGGEPEMPFAHDDERIRKVPYTVHRPTTEELKRVRFLINAAEIR